MGNRGGGMSGGAALTLGGGGRKGGGGIFGGSGPGGKKGGILAGVGSASDCSAITWILLPSTLCLRRPSTLLMVANCPPITSIVPLVFLGKEHKK